MPGRRSRRRRRIVVAGVDLERNTIGRASLLAELLHDDYQVEILAPGFSPDGPHLWAPIRDSAVRVRPFPGRKTLEHMEIMERVARSLRAEAILVSKPRLPSLGLAMLAKEAMACPSSWMSTTLTSPSSASRALLT